MLRNRELLENGKLWLGGHSQRISALLRQLHFYGAVEHPLKKGLKVSNSENYILFTPEGYYFKSGYRAYTEETNPGIPMEAFFPKFINATELNEKIFRILNREQSLRIQRALFALGFRWQDNPNIIVEGQQEVRNTADFIAIVSGQMVLPGGNKYHTTYYSFDNYVDNGFKEIFEDQIPISQHIRIDTDYLSSLARRGTDIDPYDIFHRYGYIPDRNTDWNDLGRASRAAMEAGLEAHKNLEEQQMRDPGLWGSNPAKNISPSALRDLLLTDKTKQDDLQRTPNPREGEIRGSAIKVRIETSRTATGKRYFSNGIKAGEVRARTQRGIFDSSF